MKNISIKLKSKNPLVRLYMKFYSVVENAEVPTPQCLGNVQFPHGLKGIIITPGAVIEDDVTIFQQVTIGRSSNIGSHGTYEGITIKKGAIICAGAKIICNGGHLVIGENAIIGANAVVTKSVGANEVWGGVPARKIKDRAMGGGK